MATISPLLYRSADDELPAIWRVFIVDGETDILFSPDGKNGQRVKETEYVGGGIHVSKEYKTAVKNSTLPPIPNSRWQKLPYIFDIQDLVQFYVTPEIMGIIGCDANYPHNYSFIESSVGLQEEKDALERLNKIINDPKISMNKYKQIYTSLYRSFETALEKLKSQNGGIWDKVKSAVSGFLLQTQTSEDDLKTQYTKPYIDKKFTKIEPNGKSGLDSLYNAFLQKFENEDFYDIAHIKSAVESYIYEKFPRTDKSGKEKSYTFRINGEEAEKITTEKYIGKINDTFIPEIVWTALKKIYFNTNVIIYDGTNVNIQKPVYETAPNVIVLKKEGNNWQWMAPEESFQPTSSTSARFIDKV